MGCVSQCICTPLKGANPAQDGCEAFNEIGESLGARNLYPDVRDATGLLTCVGRSKEKSAYLNNRSVVAFAMERLPRGAQKSRCLGV